MAHDVFISYSTKDKTTADAACALLEAKEIRCWLAPRDVLPGLSYGAQIIRAITESQVMVMVFSSHANDSRHVKNEIERAVSKGVIVIPVRIEDVVPSEELELFLSTPHWLDALKPPLEMHLIRLAETLKLLIRRGTQTEWPTSELPLSIDDMGIRVVSESEEARVSNRPLLAKFVTGATVGIDLGTTYSTLARINNEGHPLAMTNSDGKTLTPSIVLLGEDSQVLVGPSFERIAVEDPSHIIEAIKREMGNKDYFVVYQGKKLTPEFISALILKKLKQDAETQIGPIGNAVITVPYYFNDVRRKATQDAGRIAGLNVIDIINEPTAAALAYAWVRGELGRPELKQAERTVLVYDLGGGTFDVTVVRYTPTRFRVLTTDGDVMLGGLDWTRRLVDHVSEQFKRKYNTDPREDPETLKSLSQDCELAKRELSEKAQTHIAVYYKGSSLTASIPRGDFERMTADLLQRTRDTTELILQQAGVSRFGLDDVILVGGSTYMPIVEKMLTEVCGRPPSRDVRPEEAVAHGAGIHAAILEARSRKGENQISETIINRLRSVKMVDVNSHSLGIKAVDPLNSSRKINHIMIPKNTPIPFQATQKFVTNSQNAQRIHVVVLEGDAVDPDNCEQIGDFYITGLPTNLPVGSPVEVTYHYDANGRVHCSAIELTSKNAASAEIVRGGLQTKDVDVFEVLAREYHVE